MWVFYNFFNLLVLGYNGWGETEQGNEMGCFWWLNFSFNLVTVMMASKDSNLTL